MLFRGLFDALHFSIGPSWMARPFLDFFGFFKEGFRQDAKVSKRPRRGLEAALKGLSKALVILIKRKA
jgi:hypothetical protein